MKIKKLIKKMPNISIKISDKLNEIIQEKLIPDLFQNRSEVIRFCLNKFLLELELLGILKKKNWNLEKRMIFLAMQYLYFQEIKKMFDNKKDEIKKEKFKKFE